MRSREPELNALVESARAGSRESLEEVVLRIQDDVYRLAIKMLWHPDEAQDATQEILIRVITHLGGFRGDSSFRTWVYRVAANYLLTTRKRGAEQPEISFAEFGRDLEEGRSSSPVPGATEAEQNLLVEEVKLGCTQGMLLCLDREHRITYILGEIFELTGEQGAAVLEITPAAFRKRLSRARAGVRDFMREKCGLLNPGAACRCSLRVDRAIELGRVTPDRLLFATHPRRPRQDPGVRRGVREMEALELEAAALHREPAYAAPAAIIAGVRALLRSGTYEIFA